MIWDSSSLLTAAVNQLKNDWDPLRDLDRARAVAKIKQSGISIRQIAKRLDRGESGLRHLLLALQAPAADLVAARQGKLSTNDLVRRAKAASACRSAQRCFSYHDGKKRYKRGSRPRVP
jgi:transposase-like protein